MSVFRMMMLIRDRVSEAEEKQLKKKLNNFSCFRMKMKMFLHSATEQKYAITFIVGGWADVTLIAFDGKCFPFKSGVIKIVQKSAFTLVFYFNNFLYHLGGLSRRSSISSLVRFPPIHFLGPSSTSF